MTLSKKIITAAVLSAFTSAAFAATTSSTININVNRGEIIEITGSANATQHFNAFDVADVDNSTQPLGTLGVTSNLGGADCTIKVKSGNGYQLQHETTNAPLHGAGAYYSVIWSAGTTFSTVNNDIPVLLSGCSVAETETLTMDNPAVVATDAGNYKDTLTITVTNE